MLAKPLFHWSHDRPGASKHLVSLPAGGLRVKNLQILQHGVYCVLHWADITAPGLRFQSRYVLNIYG